MFMAKKKNDEIGPSKICLFVLVITIVLTGLVLAILSAVNVPAGHKAVVVGGWGDIGAQYDEGFRFINPFVQVDKVRWNTQGIEETISILTNDEYNVPVDFQVTFHLLEDRVGEIHTENPDYRDTVIRNVLRSEVRKTAADLNLTGEQLNKRRTLFESTVEARCLDKMAAYYVIVESVNVRNIDLPDHILDASEKRAAARIDIETAEYELQAEKARAEKEAIRAKAEANATILLAEGQAESIEILAQIWEDKYGKNASAIEYDKMMDFILSIRYIAALRDPECNVEFVIVPEDGPALLLDMEGLKEEAAAEG
jgi:regulator of protease activity HflC (stomatin/prohibitin superfamily)